MKFIFAFISLLILSSCSTYSDSDLNEFDRKIKAYLKKEGIQCEKSESGLYSKILEEGSGELIQYKDIVQFTYKGKLLNGDVFDEQTEAVEYPVGQLIGAWKEIMLQLKKGSKAYLISPPQLGYGTNKLDDIPQNSILIFELAVVDVK
ncbi:MAG: FKBP-type peptidyl-prolyl cis-trans isomerase [Crocinitomicaceae bacterium]|nr:FKBP-type peptidyl-prolyl cis-trans isomerase [Crocinitomicaceae bacterium]